MRGTLVALEPMEKTIRHTILGKDFYHWQLASGPVAGGGSLDDVGFEQGVDPQTTCRIREEMDFLFPALAERRTICAWSGFRPFCEDLKPVLGAVPGHKNLFVAAGHFKKGVMMAPITGKIMADVIVKGRCDYDIAALSPARFA
jgi:glycine/D-amino acid oxidase-like deaminating enzyme